MQSITIPQWLVDDKTSFLDDEDAVDFNIKDLGLCRIDFYREPGDLYDSWDISPESEGAVPDARYGNAAKEEEILSEFSCKLQHLYEVRTHYNRNGWSIFETLIYNAGGVCLVSRGS